MRWCREIFRGPRSQNRQMVGEQLPEYAKSTEDKAGTYYFRTHVNYCIC